MPPRGTEEVANAQQHHQQHTDTVDETRCVCNRMGSFIDAKAVPASSSARLGVITTRFISVPLSTQVKSGL